MYSYSVANLTCIVMANLLDLPPEILTHIISFLSYSDRTDLKLTCKILNDLCNQSQFIKNEVLKIEDLTISAEQDPLLSICGSRRVVTKIVFKRVDIGYYSRFWVEYGPNIESLTFIQSEFDNGCLFNILSSCPKLAVLKMESLNQLFMMFRPKDVKINLPFLRCLELNSAKYITDKIFRFFTDICPNIYHLSISSCENFCHPGIYNRFYPQRAMRKQSERIARIGNANQFALERIASIEEEHEGDLEPSDVIFSFLYIHHFIRTRAIHIRSLNFSNSMINVDYLVAILRVENLKLVSLNISNCSQLRVLKFDLLSKLQPSLKYLGVNDVPGCSIEVLLNPLLDLTILEMDGLQITVDALEIKGPLDKLEKLSLSRCDPTVVKTLVNALPSHPKSRLKSLSVANNDLSRDVLSVIANNFKQLTSLDLTNILTVNDTVLRSIFVNLVLLRKLILTNCEGITDGGLMGIDLGLPPLPRQNLAMFRIPLGSRAEHEILEDAARKLEIMQIMDFCAESSDASIMRLQGLQVLSLRNCKRISNLSLKNVFRFKELISLNLAECQQITSEGLSTMIPNIPSLENLNLNSCYNVNDTAVDIICRTAKRLKTLEIENCKLLTKKSLESIIACRTIKRVYARGCEFMIHDMVNPVEYIISVEECQLNR